MCVIWCVCGCVERGVWGNRACLHQVCMQVELRIGWGRGIYRPTCEFIMCARESARVLRR